MISFDEATLRKAASWQDFKEAQGLLNIGAVQESEKLENGWRGSVRVGKRLFRVTVEARTRTWFDAKCPCPANQRDGNFCSHAIAAGLHLLNPSVMEKKAEPKSPQKTEIPAKSRIPEISWEIHFQGPWQKTLPKGRLSVRLNTTASDPSPADARLTQWLLQQKVGSGKVLNLSLDLQTLPEFLKVLESHPRISSSEQPLEIETGSLLHLRECRLENDEIVLTKEPSETLFLGENAWQISATKLSRIGTGRSPKSIAPTLKRLIKTNRTTLPLDLFLKQLDHLQSHLDFTSSEWFESLQFIPETPTFSVELTGSGRHLKGQFTRHYQAGLLPRLEGKKIITSNPAAELAAFLRFSEIIAKPNPTGFFETTDPDEIRALLTRKLKQLPSAWKVTLSPALQQLSESFVFVSPRITINDSNDRLTSFTLTFETDSGTVIPNAEIRRLLRSKSGSTHRVGNKEITLSDDIERLIDPLFEELEIQQLDGAYTAKNASAAIILEISKKFSNSLSKSEQGKENQVSHSSIPASVNAELRPYQATGYSCLIDRLKRYSGALLADDMGLGKTIQTIALIERLLTSCSPPGNALVVVTTSLLGNWKAEFSRFAPSRNIVTLHGPKRDRLRETIAPNDVILTTYSTLARDLAYHLRQEYEVVVIDEASLIRNPDTDHSKAVAKLNAAHRIALTGTPVENSARDLWSIFRFIQPGWLGSRKQFEEKYERPLKSPEAFQQASTLLRLKTSPFVLRRTKQEVAPELPSKIHIDEFCTLSKEQLATYRELHKEGQRRVEEIRDSGQTAAARMQTLTTLLRLRQACCDLALFDSEKLQSLPIPRRSAKLERLLEITEQSIAAGSRILVFSQFQKQLVAIGTALTAAGINSIQLDGKTRDRQALVDRFQSPDGPPVFLISLKAGGYGLNLTAADIVIHFDPWWNPAAEAQATDRAHRIGQTKPVTVFRLLTRNTVEEKVIQLQSTKKALAETLDESLTPADLPGMSAKDLEILLK